MHETNDDLTALQRLLDASYARAGEHLRMIWGEDSRLAARQLRDELVGVQVLDLATVTPAASPASLRWAFLPRPLLVRIGRQLAAVSQHPRQPGGERRDHRRGETFLVLVHGRATETDPCGPETCGFADYVRSVYDFDWDAKHPDAHYARIDAATMLAFDRRD